MNLSPKHVAVMRALSSRDGWMSASEVREMWGESSITGTGVLLGRLVRTGLADCLRARNCHEGPNVYRLTVHGARVLELELAS